MVMENSIAFEVDDSNVVLLDLVQKAEQSDDNERRYDTM